MMTAVTERVPLHSIENIRVTIVNGRFAPELSDSRLSVLGLVIKSITEAKETHASIFPKSCLKSDTNGLFIYLPAHSHLSQPIHVLHLMNKKNQNPGLVKGSRNKKKGLRFFIFFFPKPI